MNAPSEHHDPLIDVVTECIDAAELAAESMAGRPEDAIAAVLTRHPDHAAQARRILASLHGIGMVDNERPFTERLGDYRLLRRLGQGGMGVVFLAEQQSLRRLVALKLLHPHFGTDARMNARFQREAEAIAKLRHPHIVAVHASGEEDGYHFTAMEFVPGRGLHEALDSGPQDRRELLRWIRDVGHALQCAHDADVLHRDVKPSNIRIADDGRAMLLDFGLARDLSAPTLTLTGSFQGSPQYASPEQIDSARATPGTASDIYSLGVTLFESVVGQPPFGGSTTEQLFHAILHADPPSPRRLDPKIPRDLEIVILTAIARRPEDRYPSAAAFAADLDALLELRPIAARPPRLRTRAHQWMRRHRVLTASVIVALITLASVLAGSMIRSSTAAHAELLAANSHLTDARSRLAQWRTEREQATTIARQIAKIERATVHRSRADWDRLEQLQAQLRTTRSRMTAGFVAILKALDLAEEHPQSRPSARRLRASAYLERYLDATERGDSEAATFAATMVESNDDKQRHHAALHPRYPVRWSLAPSTATAWLLRYERHPDQSRLVPVPAIGPRPTDPSPGTLCLRVLESSPPFAADDIIYRVQGTAIENAVFALRSRGTVQRGDRLRHAGAHPVRTLFDVRNQAWPAPPSGPLRPGLDGEFERANGAEPPIRARYPRHELGDACDLVRSGPARLAVFRRGARFEAESTQGLDVITTAAPLLCTPACRVHPRTLQSLASGDYLLVAEAHGHESVRVPFECPPAAIRPGQWLDLRLVPLGTSPRGFQRIGTQDHWIQRHEVTLAQYLEFLNDSVVQAEIQESPRPIRYPRNLGNAMAGGYLHRDPRTGRYSTVSPWTDSMPVLGISWADATAYAQWRTNRAYANQEPWRFQLPTWGNFCLASRFGSTFRHRQFAYGLEFRPHWSKSCNARSYPCVEPVLSFPIDESPCGVFDLTGSASEWSRELFAPERGERWIIGASWANAQAFRFSDGTGAGEVAVSETFGFRLVAEPIASGTKARTR